MTPHTQRSHPSRPLLALLLAIVSFASVTAQTSNVTIDASSVVRDVPAGLGGACAATPFWNTVSPSYRDGLVKARMGLVRIVGFPADSAGGVGSLDALDTKVAQLINAGAAPLFIQCIESNSNTTFKNALLRLDGTPYPAGDTTPINQRVATNITYLANRYKSPPFNLTTQYWEMGNEPDLANVNYAVATTQEYIDFFSLAHNELVASGVRGNVLLAGPVISWDYGYGGFRDTIMNDFLAACKDQVDIVTRHVYGLIYSWEGITNTAYNQLNSGTEMVHFNHTIGSTRGEKALLNKMNAVGVPATVGTGITEMNLFTDYVQVYNHTIVQGLWFLLSDHYTLYNPRSLVTTGFQFDRYNDNLAYFNSDASRGFPYWAAYIHGVLTGDQVLTQTSSDSHVVVTASKDDSYVYVQVLNRHDATTYTANVTISNAPSVTAPTRFDFTATATPDTGTLTALGTTFSHVLPPLTAAVFRYPRTDAPVPPTPAPDPIAVHLDVDFNSAPAGLETYFVGFTPAISAGQLKLTSTTPTYSRAAVILNGQPLPIGTTRLQARFGFKVAHPNAEGFVFGAYSANPGAVGNSSQALGYQGQSNQLWGVKVDNNPDQIAIVTGSAVNASVEGWVTQPLSPYSGYDMYSIIDYDGAAGTVRARLYQGTDDTGVLKADIVNRLDVPASLPVGTVFGFTGSTSNYTQSTYIESLKVLYNDFVVGQEAILDNTSGSGVTFASSWPVSSFSPGYYGTDYAHDNNANKGSASVTYAPALQGSGYRDVYVRYTSATNRATNARYIINHAGGSEIILKNQRVSGGTWVKLGTWSFHAGSTGNVVISNTSTDGVVVADAVRFVNVNAP